MKRIPHRRPAFECLSALMLAMSTALLQGCQSPPQPRADYDRATDFSRYRSFKFVVIPATYRSGFPSELTRQIAAAVRSEMARRGYRPAQNYADLLVNFSARLGRRPHTGSSGDEYYAYRYYEAWPDYMKGEDPDAIEYPTGTLNIDLIDASRMQLVWEGVAVGEVTAKHSGERQTQIRSAVTRIFASFPFRAGEAEPSGTAGS